MLKRISIFLLSILLTFGVAQNSQAAMFDVSPTLVVPTPPGIGTGFPQWYQDFSGPATRPDANPNYGIGPLTLGVPTPGGLKLEFCPAGNPLCLSALNNVTGDHEFFWWDAGASIPIPASGALTRDGVAELILATEGTTVEAPVVFNRTRIRIDTPVGGTYTVTYPYGVKVYNVTAPGGRGINDTLDEGCAAGTINCNFRLALNTELGPFLFWDAGLPVPDGVGGFYIGDATTPHKVLGSPTGANFFRVDGPPGSNIGGPGIDFIQTDLFTVSGKVFTAAGNTAPVAVPETVATLKATPVVIDVLANDTFTDVPINPGSVAITTSTGGTAVPTIINGRVKVTFTPAPEFTGPGGFSYTVTGFAGMVSAPTAVAVTVEDLKVTKTEFRPKFLKWRISGTSSDDGSDGTPNSIDILSGPPTVSATLSGANEVPSPISSQGSGTASVTVGEGSINFVLNVSGLFNITATHLHLGAVDASGPILFELAGVNVASANGTLTAANLRPDAGINFDAAVNAILSGNTYIQVHTSFVPAGELRGQLGPNRMVASGVPVQPNGIWVVDGKSNALPDATQTISARSVNGVRVSDVPLKVK